MALRERKGDGSAKVEVGEVGGAKKGILRHHRVQANVDGSEGGNVGGGRTGGGETVTSRGAANAPADVVSERARRAGAEESRRSPLFFDDPVVIGRGRSVRVNGSEGTCALHELDEFVIVSVDPLVPKGTSQRRTKCQGLAAESMLRTGAPADVARRREAGARRLAAKGEGEDRRCRKQERERKGGAPAEAAARDREGRESLLMSSLDWRG